MFCWQQMLSTPPVWGFPRTCNRIDLLAMKPICFGLLVSDLLFFRFTSSGNDANCNHISQGNMCISANSWWTDALLNFIFLFNPFTRYVVLVTQKTILQPSWMLIWLQTAKVCQQQFLIIGRDVRYLVQVKTPKFGFVEPCVNFFENVAVKLWFWKVFAWKHRVAL